MRAVIIAVVGGLLAVGDVYAQTRPTAEQLPADQLPGWPQYQSGSSWSQPWRRSGGMFGERVLGQSLRPRMSASRLGPSHVVRGPLGGFRGLSTRMPSTVEPVWPWQYELAPQGMPWAGPPVGQGMPAPIEPSAESQEPDLTWEP